MIGRILRAAFPVRRRRTYMQRLVDGKVSRERLRVVVVERLRGVEWQVFMVQGGRQDLLASGVAPTELLANLDADEAVDEVADGSTLVEARYCGPAGWQLKMRGDVRHASKWPEETEPRRRFDLMQMRLDVDASRITDWHALDALGRLG